MSQRWPPSRRRKSSVIQSSPRGSSATSTCPPSGPAPTTRRCAARIVAAAERTLTALPAGRDRAARKAAWRRSPWSHAAIPAAAPGRGGGRGGDHRPPPRRPRAAGLRLNGTWMQSFCADGLAARAGTRSADRNRDASRPHGLVNFEVLGRLIRLQALSGLGDFTGADAQAAALDELGAGTKDHSSPCSPGGTWPCEPRATTADTAAPRRATARRARCSTIPACRASRGAAAPGTAVPARVAARARQFSRRDRLGPLWSRRSRAYDSRASFPTPLAPTTATKAPGPTGSVTRPAPPGGTPRGRPAPAARAGGRRWAGGRAAAPAPGRRACRPRSRRGRRGRPLAPVAADQLGAVGEPARRRRRAGTRPAAARRHVVGGQDVQQPELEQLRGGTLPDWLPPRTMLEAPMTMRWPCLLAALAASTVVGNSEMCTPSATDSATWSASRHRGWPG